MDTVRRLFGLEGRSAVVIGAAPVGRATAKLFEEAGARSTLLPTIHDGPEGGLDPCDEAAVATALATAAGAEGVDVVVYAVTTPGTYPFAEMTLAQWDRLQDANLRGAFVVLRGAVGRMVVQGRGGRIIAISTIGALHPVLNGNAAYGASKAGLNAMIRAVALDHAADGILANVVLCGAVPVGPPPPDAGRSAGPAFQPGRLMLGMADPETIAAAVLYLASAAGAFTTGQSLGADGGFLIS